jgi:omega-hydroxy-beta-dihydromenaquinone-9 sulfotransferase
MMPPFALRDFSLKQLALARQLGLGAALSTGALHIGLLGANLVGGLVDAALFRGWRAERIESPVFIIGMQRSGTTFLHRLLSADSATRALRFWEMVLPTVTAQRAVGALGRWDAARGGPWRDGLQRWQERSFGAMDTIHRFRLDAVEEDEFVLWTTFMTDMCALDSPVCAEPCLARLRAFDQRPRAFQRRAMAWYRAALQRHQHTQRAQGALPFRYVSKNPRFSQRVPLLREAFPDACFVHLVRDPRETIASRLSMLDAIWRQRYPRYTGMGPAQVALVLEDCAKTYTLAQRDLAGVPEAQKVTLRYPEHSQQPRRTVLALYEHFGWAPPDQAMLAALEGAEVQALEARTAHRYELERYGLDAAAIEARLPGIFEEHGFEGAAGSKH